MAAAMLALQAEELRPRVRVLGQALSRQIGKKEQPFRASGHRGCFLQKLRVRYLVIGQRQPRQRTASPPASRIVNPPQAALAR